MITLTPRHDLVAAAGMPPEAERLLSEAREQERVGCFAEALAGYEQAIAAAERTGAQEIRIEALRRLAVLRYHRGDRARARELCQESYDSARRLGLDVLAALALNTIGGLDLSIGALEPARAAFVAALELGGSNRELHARVQQNLGIVANIQGEVDEAIARYERSLAAYRECGDQHGCALTFHNLGMASSDRGHYSAADCYFRESRVLAAKVGDTYLEGLCLVNQAQVDVARQRFESARQNAEEALALFDQLGAQGPKADAYRVIGMVYRETGRVALAESRLRTAIELAAGAGGLLGEAEARHELALLCQSVGRNPEALQLLNAAYRLFGRIDARTELVHVGAKVAELKALYLAVVRDWGRSIESADVYTFGHCERVAQHALATARLLGVDEEMETTVLLGAYLHDLGKLRTPHEILRKVGPLTPDERTIMEQHPLRGVEMLQDVEFPWDLTAVIRWHHERFDGTGYPDGLVGDAIPLSAQIVGIADYYDALVTRRPEQPAIDTSEALDQVKACRAHWSGPVVAAFLKALAARP
jgi:ribonuclease P protein subunit RPR2